MNIHETVLLRLMIKEIFNIQISACQVINKEQVHRNMEMGVGEDREAAVLRGEEDPRGGHTARGGSPGFRKQDRQITQLSRRQIKTFVSDHLNILPATLS